MMSVVEVVEPIVITMMTVATSTAPPINSKYSNAPCPRIGLRIIDSPLPSS
jgi:hypothetical protein